MKYFFYLNENFEICASLDENIDALWIYETDIELSHTVVDIVQICQNVVEAVQMQMAKNSHQINVFNRNKEIN